VDNHDEELNLENVDEVVVQQLASLQTSQPSTPLDRAVRNLQIIYTEKRRVERVWERLNEHVSTLELPLSLESSAANEPGAFQPTQVPGITALNGRSQEQEKLPIFQRKPAPGKHSWNRRRWRNTGIGLVAALILITLFATFFTWPIFVSHTSSLGGPPSPVATASPQSQSATPEYKGKSTSTPVSRPTPTITSSSTTATPLPTASSPTAKVYSGKYFTLQYPENWVITSDVIGGTSRQAVKFRPSATSTVVITVIALYPNTLPASQLLNTDPDVALGVLQSTSTVTSHGISWSEGIVNRAGTLLVQPDKLEIAYSNQNAPYKIELSAPPSTFDAYSPVFGGIVASFYSKSPQ
jgi:hypothetical protein